MRELIFILDRSGSMAGLESDTIGGFNSVLSTQKEEDNEGLLTTVLFDNHYELLHDRLKIKDIKPLTEEEYYVRGMTALLDAIGKTIINIEQAQDKQPVPTLITIITDGLENASREFTYEHIKELIYRKEKHDNWKFVFLGANIDTFDVASKMGISFDSAQSYVSDERGISSVYKSLNKNISMYKKIRKDEDEDDDNFSIQSFSMDFCDIEEDLNSRE